MIIVGDLGKLVTLDPGYSSEPNYYFEQDGERWTFDHGRRNLGTGDIDELNELITGLMALRRTLKRRETARLKRESR